MVLFFFMQKTAYEMRISDWSFRRVLFRSIEIGAKPRDICIVDAVPIAFAKMEGFALRVLQRRVEDQALEDAVAIAAVSVLVGQDQRVTAQILDAQSIQVDPMFIQIFVVPPDIAIVIDAATHGSGRLGRQSSTERRGS